MWIWAGNQLRCVTEVYTTNSLLKPGCDLFFFGPGEFGNNTMFDIKCTFWVTSLTCQSKLCNAVYTPQPVIPMYMTILAQSNLIFSLCLFMNGFLCMYLRINIVAYRLLLIYSVFMQICWNLRHHLIQTGLDLTALRVSILETLLLKDLTWLETGKQKTLKCHVLTC